MPKALIENSRCVLALVRKNVREQNVSCSWHVLYNLVMAEREFLIYLDPETRLCRYRHYHVSKGRKIVEFRIQLEVFVDEEWYPVVRYDTAHGKPHRDILQPNGEQTKDWFGSKVTPLRMFLRSVRRTLWIIGLPIATVL